MAAKKVADRAGRANADSSASLRNDSKKGGTQIPFGDDDQKAKAKAKTEARAKARVKPKANLKPKPASKKELADAEALRIERSPMSQCGRLEGAPQLAFPREAMRLGFPVKVLGAGGLKTSDMRRHTQDPHLRVSLGYLCGVIDYLRANRIHMYRMSSDIAPYATHPGMPRFHTMVRDSAGDLAHFGRLAREADVRLSFHPSQYIVLNSENEALTQKSMADLDSQAEMLDLMECGPEAVLVVHVGGAYGDRETSWRRWAATWPRLSEPVQRRLVLENDDIRFSAADVLKVHEATGVKCVWDYQHHWCMNPEGLPLVDTLKKFCATWRAWPGHARPKMHFSCARTEMREIKRKNRRTGLLETVLQPPIWTGHADYNNPFETITFLRSIADVDVDIMLESKAKDLSLLRLRRDIARFAPELAARYAIDLPTDSETQEELAAEIDDDEEAAVA